MRVVNGRDCPLAVRSAAPERRLLLLEGAALTRFELDNQIADVTNGADLGWKSLLSSAGERQVRVEAGGIHLGGEAEVRIREIAITGSSEEFQLSLGSTHMLRGEFIVERLKYEALQDDELSFTLSLASAGPVSLV